MEITEMQDPLGASAYSVFPIPLDKHNKKSVFYTRFLTPHKFALCLLVEFYAQHATAPSCSASFLDIILEYFDSSNSLPQSLIDLYNITTKLPSTIDSYSVYDLLHERLWSLHSYEDIHEIFMSLGSYITNLYEPDEEPPSHMLFSPSSVLSVFLRKCVVEYEQLSFEQGVEFFKSFLEYRSPSMNFRKDGVEYCKVNVRHELLGLASNQTLLQLAFGSTPGCHATQDIERLIQLQIQHMQRYGCFLPEEMKRKLHDILEAEGNHLNTSYHFRFLNAWFNGDYQQSIENLCRYFDHVMHSNERVSYQYALLNLSILQADFGCDKEALRAIEDTINTARESGDIACLNFALAWMYEFKRSQLPSSKDKNPEEENHILEHLAINSQSAQIPVLQSTVHLMQAQHFLDNGSNMVGVFSNLTKSFALQCHSESFHSFSRYMDLLQETWYRLGCFSLSFNYISLYQNSFFQEASVIDLVKSYMNKARRLVENGNWSDVSATLQMAKMESERSFQSVHFYGREKCFLYLDKAINEKNYKTATFLLKSLNGFRHSKESLFNTHYYSLKLDISLGNFSQCIDAVENLLEDDTNLTVEWKVKLMLLKVDIYIKTNVLHRAIFELLNVIEISSSSFLRLYLLEALCLLCLIGSLDCIKATELLDSLIPEVIASGNKALVALSFYSYASIQVSSYDKLKASRIFITKLLDNAFDGYKSCHMKDMQQQIALLKIQFLKQIKDNQASRYTEQYYKELFMQNE
ncbi:anaphase-promoting complex, platform subcomplex scaffold TPR subunit Apc5 [Schizosaccharomyces osmophilus]|uniref:Anaphase-promoting complex subunit 5 n=1 Tax=Schizosaccharomyces osmophilus TaxID=2545709 RepID=A0AAE9WCA5_9SCHI|nr:anaphase-promoting complex, platform subcomplex scaffold TPR subunit Apc5 [Schizosaccharomyces osmophilus]WBW72582.1 anaphase-promoting complex, platform subcomplex scaffold TPR subunit Apc5 [Schizosaccharomyces osmophilus]